LVIANFRDSISKLTARHKCQQIVPILQRELTEIVWFGILPNWFFVKVKNSHFHWMNCRHCFAVKNLILCG
jgi:hypothetical protein